MKATAKSPANIAFIKYWGRKDDKLFLPLTTTNSMNLSGCIATTTIEFSEKYKKDEIVIIDSDDKEKEVVPGDGGKNDMLFETLNRARANAGKTEKAKVVSKLTFPLGAGIASSAAGMSAFVAAAYSALGANEKVEDRKELSREVRLSGSVSAARSVEDGFTEMIYGENNEECVTKKIADPDHWDLIDLVAVLDAGEKKISSSQGHEISGSSPFMKARVEYLEGKPEIVRRAILDKDFATLARYSEMDTINMHAVMMTSDPMALYFAPGSIDIIHKVVELRNSGIEVFYSFDAGANPHVITTSKYADQVEKLLKENPFIQFTLRNQPCEGTRILNEHLF